MTISKSLLADKVMTTLLSKLERWGNQISKDHKQALRAITNEFVHDVFRDNNDARRLAVGLDTGLGKTALLVTFLNTLKEEGIQYPTLVCVPNLKAMKELRDGLLEAHTPEEVGCKFQQNENSRSDGLDFPPAQNDELSSFKIVITCHARADSTRSEWEKLLDHPSKKRAVFYDEALKRGNVVASPIRELESDFILIKDFLDASLRDEISNLIDKLKDAHEDEIIPLAFDSFAKGMINRAFLEHRQTGGRDRKIEALLELISGKYDQVRHGSGDYFTYQNTLPEMQSLFVLDANHPYSPLSQLDESIKSIVMPRFKSFGSVTFKAYPYNVGKKVIEKNQDFYIEWAVKAVQEAKAEGKNPVVICFKDMETKVRQAIQGVSIITWGKHAGSNQYSDKDAIVCIGVLRNSDNVTKGHITLNRNDIAASVDNAQQIAAVEAALNLYQAVSRGQSRQVSVIDGKTVAKPSTIYLSGPLHKKQLALLEEVMPGCSYIRIEHPEVVAAIKDYFRSYPFGDSWNHTLSMKQLLKDVEPLRKLKETGRNTVYRQLVQEGWRKDKRSLTEPIRFNGRRFFEKQAF